MNNNKILFLDVIKYCWSTWTSSFELYISCWAAYLIQVGVTFIAGFYTMALLGNIPLLNFFTFIEYFGVYSVQFAIAMITVPIYAFIHLALTGVCLAIVDGKKLPRKHF